MPAKRHHLEELSKAPVHGKFIFAPHAMAILQFHQAKALKELPLGSPDPGLMQELHSAMTDRPMKVVQEFHLCLNLAQMPTKSPPSRWHQC